MTVLDFRKELLENILPGDVCASTTELYDHGLRKFVEIAGNKRLSGLTSYDVERFKTKRLKQVSPAKCHMDFRTLRAAFNRALKFGMIKANPFVACSNVRIPQRQPAFLSKQDFRRLLQGVDNVQMRAIIILAICTAMRRGELVHLRWEDIDMVHGFIHLKNTDEYTLKTRKERSVPLNNEAIRALQSIPRISEYVFAGANGNPLKGESVSKMFKRYVRQAGIDERIHFHSLRHTGATWLVQANVPIVYVKEILGHSNVATTMIYAHTSTEHLQESVSRLERFMLN